MNSTTRLAPVSYSAAVRAMSEDRSVGLLTIRRKYYLVRSLAEASEIYSQVRDASGEGGSTFEHVFFTLGHLRYEISYNGKIWARPAGSTWQSGEVPAFGAPYVSTTGGVA